LIWVLGKAEEKGWKPFFFAMKKGKYSEKPPLEAGRCISAFDKILQVFHRWKGGIRIVYRTKFEEIGLTRKKLYDKIIFTVNK